MVRPGAQIRLVSPDEFGKTAMREGDPVVADVRTSRPAAIAHAPRTAGDQHLTGDRPPSEQLNSLTGLRAIAATAVFAIHTDYLFRNNGRYSLVDAVMKQGTVGVSLFFILSGFVLTWKHKTGTRSKRMFWRRRAARILPAYLLVLVLFGLPVTAYLSHGDLGPDLGRALFNATLLQSWIPSPRWFAGGNTVGWSLSTEAFFYAAFPFLIGPMLSSSRRVRGLLLVAALAAAVAIPVVVHPSIATISLQRGVGYWLVYIAPPVRLLEFVVGMLVASLLRDGVRVPVGLVPASGLAIGSYVLAGRTHSSLAFVAITIVPFALLIAAAAQADLAGRRSVFRSRWLVHAGVRSYSFYLVHFLIVRVAMVTFAPEHSSLPTKIVGISACFSAGWVIAYFIYRFVEHPAEQRFRGASARRETVGS
jgi:peptidoglycan/LPS O-acetylase OafA/YrhL